MVAMLGVGGGGLGPLFVKMPASQHSCYRYASHLGDSSVDKKYITLILLLLYKGGGLWLKI